PSYRDRAHLAWFRARGASANAGDRADGAGPGPHIAALALFGCIPARHCLRTRGPVARPAETHGGPAGVVGSVLHGVSHRRAAIALDRTVRSASEEHSFCRRCSRTGRDGVRTLIDAFTVVKFIHVMSSTILFGTGIGTAFQMWSADRTGDPRMIAA